MTVVGLPGRALDSRAAKECLLRWHELWLEMLGERLLGHFGGSVPLCGTRSERVNSHRVPVVERRNLGHERRRRDWRDAG